MEKDRHPAPDPTRGDGRPLLFSYYLQMSPTTHFSAFLPLLTDTLTYGVYSVLFFQSVQVLYTRRTPNYKLHLGCIITLFVLSTFHITIAYAWASITDTADFAIYEVFSLQNPLPVLYAPEDPRVVRLLGFLIKLRWVLANTLADGFLIYRCYIIWGSNWRAIAFPLLSYACTMIGGFLGLLPLSGSSERVALVLAYGTTFFTNVMASLLAAGRIWWISRRIAILLGKRKAQSRYMDLTAIILESGLIYPATLILTIVVYLVPATPTVAVLSCIAAAYHLVARGIAPTMIIVRVGLGVSTDNVEESVNLSRNTGLGTSQITREIQFRDGSLTADDETLEDGIIFARDKAV
ncbi:Rtt106 domain-containing protein [Mycena venus]|uniref:Rtt106 domain-containing protein n=1 Tax=Mycena venus TaxID=2733690 RepID=A0A8H6X333_9AGAR|nr:Rtt106 domain-containing protein [Mycena venus]